MKSQPERTDMLQKFVPLSVFLVAFQLAASSASSQTNLRPPPQIPYGLSIGLAEAKKAAAAAIEEARKNNWNMAVAIVDTGGYLVYFERMDNTQTGSVDLAIEKAHSSALFRRPTRLFQDGVAGGGEGLRLLRLTGAIPIEGGSPIIEDDKIIGAIGVSGGSGDQDGSVAKVGADAVR